MRQVARIGSQEPWEGSSTSAWNNCYKSRLEKSTEERASMISRDLGEELKDGVGHLHLASLWSIAS